MLDRLQPTARVLLVSFVADAPWTGMGHWTHAVVAALQADGFHVDAWFSDQFPGSRASGRLAVLFFPLALVRQLLARRRDYDVFVIHEPSALWYALARKLRPSLPPLVLMCHNVETRHLRAMVRYTDLGLARVSRLTRVRSAIFRSWQSANSIKTADHVLCLSSVDERYIEHELGVPRDRITRLVNGIDPDDVLPHVGSSGGCHVLWVGGWLDVKGRHVLPMLWRRLRKSIPAAVLTLVGTGAPPAAVVEEFDPLDRASVTVRPQIADRTELRELYGSVDAFLLTSLSEGSPLALLEAMAAGLPVVATRAGGVPDIVDHGTHGLLFDPDRADEGADHLHRLLTNPEEARCFGKNAQTRASALLWQNTVSPMAAALRRVIERQSR